ncbi:efflux RND transporter periplasmic adaptor subunit [Vibrio sp. SCSIO 43136]|uniref:efflux RND transporter periplasmic adaptor subunit n=1 Tax=Vibrio sp. SCSIO 43136 TaxID=2819101 RepID=UPI0020759877|nr:efflux RND transporter periplasmic adaptor subunit [Vibrio sp. SCSIO 43136]USD68216.1 efflux RND transporter periplasmic adaptor subunit [Vibrio sp. SCSIO 43136]
MKSSKLLLGGVLFALLGLLFLYMAGFFTPKIAQQEEKSSSVDTDSVQLVELAAKNTSVYREFTGTVGAEQKAILSARLTAKVAEVLVDVGDVVTQGDVLMRLESDDLDARVMQTEQALSSAQAQLNASRKEFDRVNELVSKKLLPQSEFDRVESQLQSATANFKQAQAAVSEAETTFGFSIITAPFNGVITQRPINQGDTASPGAQLLSIYNPDSLQLEVDIAESLIRNISLGSELEFVLPTFEVAGVGQVAEISPAVDNTSRSFLVKLDLNEVNQVYPGVYGKVKVLSHQEPVLTLPKEALYKVGQLDYVQVLEDDVRRTRLVQLGQDNRVRKGVKEGEKVILHPLGY